jgi:predicted  nucleic acid-binding Zn-ribbon protein
VHRADRYGRVATSLEEVEGRVKAAEEERDALKARLEEAEKDSAKAVDSSERWGLFPGFDGKIGGWE